MPRCQRERMSKPWSEFPTSPQGLPLAAMRACFRARVAAGAAFREDAALADALCDQAEPVLQALHVALAAGGSGESLHEPYALATLLARRAALLGATPSTALLLADALVAALVEAAGLACAAELARALSIVCVEGYCAARDERVESGLLEVAARSQVAVLLGPGCLAIFLAGCHDERALGHVLDGFARRLLHDQIASCLVDVSRLAALEAADDALARSVASFCVTASTLGVALTLLGASSALRARFAGWLHGATPPDYADDYAEAQARALALAGLIVKSRWPWPRSRLLAGRGRAG